MISEYKPKFKLGKIVITQGALSALVASEQLPDPFLKRHITGDWGDVCEEDANLNNEAIAHEGAFDKQMRVLSAYKTNRNEAIWIITEWDRSATTLLLPSEY